MPRPNPNPNPDFLEGIPAIARYMGKCYTTIWNWIHYDGFPAAKSPKGVWFTHKDAIIRWIFAGHAAEIEAWKQERDRLGATSERAIGGRKQTSEERTRAAIRRQERREREARNNA